MTTELDGFWAIDPDTGEPTWIAYTDIPEEMRWEVFRPLGGFVYPVGQFKLLDLPETPFYIKDWLPKRGRCLLYAPRKSGKSFLALQAARCIGVGEPFLGLPTTAGVVLLLQFELGLEVFQGRVRSTGKDYHNVFVGTVFTMKIDSTIGQEMLRNAVEAVSPDVIILDPLYKLISNDENETSDMRRVVDELDKYVSQGCSLLIIHHAGKDLTRGARGAVVLEDWADSVLEMKKVSKKGEPLRVQITPVALRHAANPPEPIVAEMDSQFEFQVVGEEATVAERIVDYLAACPQGVTVERGAILRAGIGSNTSVQRALNQLCEKGVIERVGRGEYRLAQNTQSDEQE